jgi:hypothetical protein
VSPVAGTQAQPNAPNGVGRFWSPAFAPRPGGTDRVRGPGTRGRVPSCPGTPGSAWTVRCPARSSPSSQPRSSRGGPIGRVGAVPSVADGGAPMPSRLWGRVSLGAPSDRHGCRVVAGRLAVAAGEGLLPVLGALPGGVGGIDRGDRNARLPRASDSRASVLSATSSAARTRSASSRSRATSSRTFFSRASNRPSTDGAGHPHERDGQTNHAHLSCHEPEFISPTPNPPITFGKAEAFWSRSLRNAAPLTAHSGTVRGPWGNQKREHRSSGHKCTASPEWSR